MLKVTNPDRRQFLRNAAMTLAASQFGLAGSAEASIFSEGSVPPLNGATAWLNSRPLKTTDLRGKVLLVDFWTYTCINWRRTLPFLRAWDDKYGKHGLTVVGVHTPEFAFEHTADNVRQAVTDMKISYPVAIDSNYAVWRGFNNEYWPALYLADAQGHVRYHKFGEGDYEETERQIQKLLKQVGTTHVDSELISTTSGGAEAAPDWADLGSQENYIGYERTVGFASPGGAAFGKPRQYELPRRLALNEWALAGNWTARKDAAALNAVGGRVAYRFHARDLHLVMGSAIRDTPVRFRVSIDGEAPGPAHGTDVDEQGYGTVSMPQMYQVIRQRKPIVDRTFEIEFLAPGVEVFSFTFG